MFGVVIFMTTHCQKSIIFYDPSSSPPTAAAFVFRLLPSYRVIHNGTKEKKKMEVGDALSPS